MSMDRAAKSAGRVLLPSHFVPKRYTLSLEPDLKTFVFPSTVEIEFDVDKPKVEAGKEIKEVVLHAKEISFHSASVTLDNGTTSHACEAISVQLKGEPTVTFQFEVNLAECDNFTMTIDYTGSLNNQMAGFYRSGYTDRDGKAQIMGSTQFESLDARRAFPCVDEPSVKATFVVSLTVDKHLQALSNMPVSKMDSVSSTKTKYTFMETPVMSTYLLAFCVGEFDCVTAFTPKSKIQVSVYTPPGQSKTGQFALDTALHNLETYNEFFDCPYPLPKLDMVAIPEFAAGAMENWGLVTYRQVDLLIDPVTASQTQKQRVAIVVAHELAHQWFGNLVTMAWWDDLWLNEGFASWCENYATDLLHGDYKMWDQFAVGHLAQAMQLDALQSSHPIQVPIRHAQEVEQVFDAISYCKGASVVRMACAVLGMPAFRQGLQAYMKQYSHSNTETYDLWQAWEVASKMPVGEIMKSWTEQMGFPYVVVKEETWKDDSVELTLEQSWFLSDGGANATEEEMKKLWTIPIMTCTQSGVQSDMVLMREKTATITIPLAGATDWIKLNAGQQVPMRVLLTPTMIQRLKPAIQDSSSALSAIDRASLLTDAYALVKAGHMKPESLIELLCCYKKEETYIVWSCLASVFNGLDSMLSESPAVSEKFQAFAKSLVLGLMEKVGWEPSPNDDHLSTLLRGVMISLLKTFCASDPDVQKEATRRFDLFWNDFNDVQALPSDYRAAVFSIVLKTGDSALYEKIKSYYTKADNNAEAKHVLNSLGSIDAPELKLKTMEWAISGEIKLQDLFYAFGSVSRSNKSGRDIAWKFFQDEFEKIKSMYMTASPSLMNACIVMCAGGGFCTVEKAKEIEDFFEAHPLPSSSRKIAQTVEAINTNAKFFETLTNSTLLTDAEYFDKMAAEMNQS